MRAALTSEYRKIVTTRMWWVLLICFGLFAAFMAAIMAFSLHAAPTGGSGSDMSALPLTDKLIASTVYSLATSLGYAFPLVVGTLLVTNEFRYQTITPTLLAEASRTRVLVAKLGAAFAVGLIFGVVGTVATVLPGAGAIAIAGADPMLSDPAILRGVGLSVIALAVWTVVGVGFGTALPNQIAAIVVVLGFTQLVEPVLRMGLAAWEPTAGIAQYFPGAAGDAITGGSLYNLLGTSDMLEWWQGLILLLGYAAALAALGRFTTLRRDIT